MWQAVSARVEGLVALRDRDGARHGIWVQAGFVVGIHVAGRFDPLLDLLRQHGALSAAAYRACVQALGRTACRSGAVAAELAGVARPLVRDALKHQARTRMLALLAVARERGHDARFEPRKIPASEIGMRIPLGALLRAPSPAAPRDPQPQPKFDREQARRKLRALALHLHPDLHPHLDARTRKQLERELALATAAYHDLAPRR